MRAIVPISIAGLLAAGCAAPGWLRLPDPSSLWPGSPQTLVRVEEVARADVCNTVTGEPELSLLPGAAALDALAAQRGFEWIRTTSRPLPETTYAVIEIGQRTNGGYSLAVSRDAALEGDALLLSATYFEPRQGRWASDQPSSPCVAVALPEGVSFGRVRVFDQSGRVRVSSDGDGA